MIRSHILICGGTGCTSSGSTTLRDKLAEELKVKGLDEEIKIVMTGCFGLCALGPIMIVYPEGTFYSRVTVDDIPEIVDEHLLKGRVVDRLVYNDTNGETKAEVASLSETTFYKKQHRVALRNCGVINPENIEEYIAMDGYFALNKVLTEMTPDEVIQTILDSGLRGRGGGGFPTGLKWKFASNNRGEVKKYVACNADEGDPGAFMDRSILEGDPHALIEAMAIAGYAIGASNGYFYIRAEYPVAVQRLQNAINQCEELGLLGDNILGTGFSFRCHIRLGAGAFVCGEETALLNSIEGQRGMPRPRPPFPAVKGLWGKPTVINNVETLASVPFILRNGAEAYSSVGTEKSKGTKVFALGGKVNNVGLVEVPMGTTLRQLIYDIGGGVPGGKKFKAIQTGGPSGGCLTEKDLDVPIDYESLTARGSMMGSGGAIVMDEDNCMVDVAKFYMTFICDESCGKCSPCRIGTKRILEILEKITDGKGKKEDLDALKELSVVVKSNSLCGLGQTATNPVLSTMASFPEEYEAHVFDKKCPAHVCKNLMEYAILPEKCIGCGLCARSCPASCIAPTKEIAKKLVPTAPDKFAYGIDAEKCVKCGACISSCKFKAIIKR